MTTLLSWLKIVRIQFYPMTFIAYSVGAAAATLAGGGFDAYTFWNGYGILFFIEVATVLTNEYFDYDTDRINKNASFFTGGSQVLVENKLSFKDVKTGIIIALVLVAVLGGVLAAQSTNVSGVSVFALIYIGLFLGLGYTAPPLKFCYRGWGEIVVGITHSFYVLTSGFIFQTGIWGNPTVYLLGVPLFFSTLGAITLAGIPDEEADRTVGKETLAVYFGPKIASWAALFFVVTAALLLFFYWKINLFGYPLNKIFLLIVFSHALVLSAAIIFFLKAENFNRKINVLLQMALSYIIWFGVLPLWCLFRAAQ